MASEQDISFHDSQPSVISRIIFLGIIAILVFAPLAFGSAHVWAYTLAELGVFFLLFIHFMTQVLFSRSLAWVKTPVNGVLLLFILFIILQMIPLPGSWVAFVSPRTFADKIRILKLSDEAGAIQWMSFAYYLHPAILELLKLAACLGMFFLVLNNVRSKKRIDILIYALILLGIFQAAYSISFQVFTNDPMVWWWRRSWRGVIENSNFNPASGTFVGSNHFAFYMEMATFLCIGFMIAQKKDQKKFLPGMGGFHAFRRYVMNWFAPDSPVPKMFFLLLCSGFMGGAILLSRSRGGIFSMGIALIAMSGLFFLKRYYRKYGLMLLGLCLVILLFGTYVGIGPTLEKIGSSSQGLYMRLYTTRTMVPMFPDYPLMGVGWGNFRYIYPRYIPDDAPEGFEGTSTSGYSHNDWFEAGTEVGFAGGALMVFAFAALLVRMVRMWLKRKDFYAMGIGAGVTALLISTGIHSFFDFSMHILANPLTLAAMLGLGYVALHRKGESFFYENRKIPLSGLRRIIMAGLVVSVFVIAVVGTGRHFLAEIRYPSEWNSTLKLNRSPDLAKTLKAISHNPGNAEYHFRVGIHHFRLGKKEGCKQAIAGIKQALHLNPTQGNYWHKLGQAYTVRRLYDTSESEAYWLSLADYCYDAAIQYSPRDVHMMFQIGLYWIWRSKLLPLAEDCQLSPDDCQLKGSPVMTREQGIRKFQQIFQRVLYFDPSRCQGAAELVRRHYSDKNVVLGIVRPDDEELRALIVQWTAEKSDKPSR